MNARARNLGRIGSSCRRSDLTLPHATEIAKQAGTKCLGVHAARLGSEVFGSVVSRFEFGLAGLREILHMIVNCTAGIFLNLFRGLCKPLPIIHIFSLEAKNPPKCPREPSPGSVVNDNCDVSGCRHDWSVFQIASNGFGFGSLNCVMIPTSTVRSRFLNIITTDLNFVVVTECALKPPRRVTRILDSKGDGKRLRSFEGLLWRNCHLWS